MPAHEQCLMHMAGLHVQPAPHSAAREPFRSGTSGSMTLMRAPATGSLLRSGSSRRQDSSCPIAAFTRCTGGAKKISSPRRLPSFCACAHSNEC